MFSTRKILIVNDAQQLWGFEMTPAGLQLAKAAKSADRCLNVVLMTSYVMDNKDTGALLASLGVDAFVAKPVSHASLAELLSLPAGGATNVLPAQ